MDTKRLTDDKPQQTCLEAGRELENKPKEIVWCELIEAWNTTHSRPIDWEKAIEIGFILKCIDQAEKDRLLAL